MVQNIIISITNKAKAIPVQAYYRPTVSRSVPDF